LSMLRLFFALQPRDEQSVALTEQVAPLVTRLNAQRVPAENLHATLCFIGAVSEEKLDTLRSAVDAVRARSATLQFDSLEYWRKPGVVCATAAETTAAAPARALAERLAEATIAAGFSPDVKPFRAHMTVARKVQAARAASCEWPGTLVPSLTVHCDRFALMQSRRGETGSIYSVVNSWALDADKSV
jgi:RNA 2',3'-cyclic 3'-phosphodiesterase